MARVTDNYLDLKFLSVGDSGVGKTCLLSQYVDGKCNTKFGTTVGIDIRDKNILYKSNKSNKSSNVHLQLWDTAGQERYRSLTTSFFRDAIGFLLVFDLTNESSFLNVRNWIGEIQSNAYLDHVDMILVGNKCDLDKERVITKLRALEFAEQNQVEYIETSALQNINVAESVELLLHAVMNRLETTGNVSRQNHSLAKRVPKAADNRSLDGRLGKKTELSYCCYYY